MVDFGDDFIIESYKIPWLIWIQLLVTILLLLFLFGLALFTSDDSPTSASAPAPSAGDATAYLNNGITTVQDQRAGGGDAGTSGVTSMEEDEEESSLKETVFLSILRHPNHPCNLFGLAKEALFKCFGLDSSSSSSSSSQSSSSRQHEKRD